MSVSVQETETKYDMPEGTALPQLAGLPRVSATSGPEEQQLEADYYDTDDLRLLRAGITLRRRRGGSDAGWHLKLPAGGDTRREIQLPLGRTGTRVPRELAELVRVHTRTQKLRPVATIITTRQRLILLDEVGESLAEVASDDVHAHTLGDSTTALQWREVEVELTGGDRRLLRAADELLRRGGLQRAGQTAKLERALADQIPRQDAPARLGPGARAGDVVLAYLREHSDRMKALDPMVRGDEPDAIHQMRVSTRRLRSTLRTFKGIISRAGTEHLADELRWLGGVLGEARDAEVLTEHLRDRLMTVPVEQLIGPVQARVQGHFAPVRAKARAAVLKALDSERYFALLDELDQVIAEPPLQPRAARPAAEVLPAEVRRAYKQTGRRMQRARGATVGQDRDVALHEARKAAKRARYGGEAVAPALGKPAERLAKRAKKVQSVLGNHQDAVIASHVERSLGIGAHLAGENAFTYGLLYERETQAREGLRADAFKAWKRASRSSDRRWMN